MKLAFARTGAPHRHALWNLASFSAKRLSLVEQQQMNGLNKELKRLAPFPAPLLNPSLTMIGRRAGLFARNAGRLARRARETSLGGHGEAYACIRRKNKKSEVSLIRFKRAGS
jgi:hypothetical protein